MSSSDRAARFFVVCSFVILECACGLVRTRTIQVVRPLLTAPLPLLLFPRQWHRCHPILLSFRLLRPILPIYPVTNSSCRLTETPFLLKHATRTFSHLLSCPRLILRWALLLLVLFNPTLFCLLVLLRHLIHSAQPTLQLLRCLISRRASFIRPPSFLPSPERTLWHGGHTCYLN